MEITEAVVQLLCHIQLFVTMGCGTSGFPVLHYLPEFSQSHVHDPTNCNLPVSSVPGSSQARKLKWLPFPSPGDLRDPGIEPSSPALAGRFFTLTEPPGKPFIEAEWSLFPVIKEWEVQKGFYAQKPHRVLLGITVINIHCKAHLYIVHKVGCKEEEWEA